MYFLILTIAIFFLPIAHATQLFPLDDNDKEDERNTVLHAPDYGKGAYCSVSVNMVSSCDTSLAHMAMTLDSGIHIVLKNASCPKNVFFHFIAVEFDPASPQVLTRLIRSTFFSLNFKVYIFSEYTIINLISSSIRQVLKNPLNYPRNYLGYRRPMPSPIFLSPPLAPL